MGFGRTPLGTGRGPLWDTLPLVPTLCKSFRKYARRMGGRPITAVMPAHDPAASTQPTIDQLRNSQLVQQAFDFWFTDHEHVRSPFPAYVQAELRELSVAAFADWLRRLDPQAQKEVTDEAAVQKFEELLFREATRLVRTPDELITLRLPFLPRVGDTIDGGGIEGRGGENVIRKRKLVTEGKDEFMEVEVENLASGQGWSTRFELP